MQYYQSNIGSISGAGGTQNLQIGGGGPQKSLYNNYMFGAASGKKLKATPKNSSFVNPPAASQTETITPQ
jgi:hypothetical protein